MTKKILTEANNAHNGDHDIELGGNYGALIMQVTGTVNGTITPKGSLDKSNFVELLAVDAKTGASATAVSAAGIYQISVVGIKHIRFTLANAVAESSIDMVVAAVPLVPGTIVAPPAG